MWVGQRIICVITIKLERYIVQLKFVKNRLSIHCICLRFLGDGLVGFNLIHFRDYWIFFLCTTPLKCSL